MRVILALAATLVLALPPAGALAETADDFIRPYIRQLAEQGYSDLTVGTTWLGRIVISGIRDGTSREIVLNRRSGALLSDTALLPPAAERLSMQPSSDGDDNDSPAVVASGPTTTVTVTIEGNGGDLLDSGSVQESVADGEADP